MRFNGNSTKSKYVYKKGELNAFMIELFGGKASDNNYAFSVNNGFRVFITNETSLNNGIQIPNGFSTEIIIDKYFIIKQEKPYSECSNNLDGPSSHHSECFKRSFSTNQRKYHYTDCLNTCIQKFINEKCDCETTYFDVLFFPGEGGPAKNIYF